MLVVTRKEGQALIIGDDIKVTILGRWGNNIKIGIEAPKDVCVLREELYHRNKGKKDD